MPTNLYTLFHTSPRKIKLTALFILSPLFFYAQSLTGLWTGALSNDSNTVRKDQSFEIALTEYKGKVYGYSRSEFIVDDVLYYVVKRVKGTIEGDVCEVKDDEIIAFNFPGKLDKGVKVTSTFRRNSNDSMWYLDGTWKTNKTKNYYSVSGKVTLEEEKDLGASKIFPHLEELKLANEVAFYKDRKEGPPIVKIAKPEKNRDGISAKAENLTVNEVANVSKPVVQRSEPLVTTVAVNDENMPGPIAVNTITKEETAIPSLKTDPNKSVANNVTINPGVTSAVVKNKPEVETADAKKEVVDEVKMQPELAKTTDPNPADPLLASATTNKPVVDPVIAKKESAPNILKKEISPNSTDKPQETVVAKTQPEKTVKPADNNSVATPFEDIPRDVFVKKPAINNTTKPAPDKEPVIAKNTTPKQTTNSKITESKQPLKNTPAMVSVPVIEPNKTLEMNENWNELVTIPAIPPVMSTVAERKGAAESINARKTEVSQVVNFRSDSLRLALYDNGQVDGDTVSVLMNGEVILAKQGLKASAIRKTVYITRGKDDEFTLVLYAENLGTYPPNTGLLVVHDGEDVYNLRFSSDFQKNAAIVFRRKK